MAITITEIVNDTTELAAFPLKGNVAFFISGTIDNIEKRIFVEKKDKVYPNLSSYIYTQLGRVKEDFVPDYTIDYDSTTNKVTVSLSDLIPLEEYVVVFNTMDSYGVLAEETKLGLGSIQVENYRTGPDSVSELQMTASADSVYDPSLDLFSTVFSVSINGGASSSHTVSSGIVFHNSGLAISLTAEPFVSGDYFRFTFTPVVEEELHVIDVKTANIPSIAQELHAESKRIGELDVLAFYEEMDTPSAPTQPTVIKRVLKSSKSMIVEFTQPIDYAAMNVSAENGPAFNMLSLEETDWEGYFKIEVRQLSPVAILIKFSESSTTSNEIIKNV